MDGMGWDGMGWDGMGWDGMGWDGCVLGRTGPGKNPSNLFVFLGVGSEVEFDRASCFGGITYKDWMSDWDMDPSEFVF